MTIKQTILLAAAAFGLVLLLRGFAPETPRTHAGESAPAGTPAVALPDSAADRQNHEASDYNSTNNWPPRSYCTASHGHFLDAVCRERMKRLW
jgi:hypothetical protein